MQQIAVFDTNVLLSGLGWMGKPFQCLELARSGRVDGVTCPELLDELVEKLQEKLAYSQDQTIASVADLLTFLRPVSITGHLKGVQVDPDDDKVLECAVVAGATHIVTGDRRHLLPMGRFHDISIVSPADFLIIVASP